jgi:GntR family transcriptional regulator
MMISVNPHTGVPVYRQLMDQIKFLIASGLLGSGDELPSTRALSAELGINPMTISKAYGYLEMEGVVERRPGRPLVVRKLDRNQIRQQKTEQLRQSLHPIVTMIRQFGISDEVARRLFNAMLEENRGRASEERKK